MKSPLPSKLKKRIENDSRLNSIAEKHGNDWSKFSIKEFEEVVKIINKGATEFAINYDKDGEVLNTLGLGRKQFERKKTYFKRNLEEKVFPKTVNSRFTFINYYKSTPGLVFPWKHEKTIKRNWNGETAFSKQTVYVLLAFLGVDYNRWNDEIDAIFPDKKPQINPEVQGYYQFYNLEKIPGSELTFQIAQLILTDNEQFFIYKSINSNRIHLAKVVHIPSVYKKTVSIEIKGRDFEVKMYISFPRSIEIDKKMYALYIYMSRTDEPYASAVVLHKVRSRSDLIPPNRECKAIPLGIKQALAMHPIISKEYEYLLRGKQDTSIKGKLFQTYEKYTGVYYLYCNKKYEYEGVSHPNPNENSFISWIGRDIFEIYEGELPNQLLCKLKSEKFGEKTGEIVISEKLKGTSLICNLYNSESLNARFLNLIFHIGSPVKHKMLFGAYNTVYDSNKPVGSGLVVIKRIVGKTYDDCAPGIINPLKNIDKLICNGQSIPLDQDEQKIVNYLSLNSESRLESLSEKKHLEKDYKLCNFAGTYKIYAYGRKRNNGKMVHDGDNRSKMISIGALEIYPFRYVRHRGDFERESAEGIVHTIDGNLFITLVNKEDGKRTGTFFIRVESKIPREGRIYCGTFSGVSPDSRRALGNRVIIEYCSDMAFEEINTERINIYDPEIHSKVPSQIRKALIGRWVNFINFYTRAGIFSLNELNKENKKQLSLGKRFFHSACYFIIHEGDIEEGVKDLQRALEHGYGSYKQFEAEIKKNSRKTYKDLLKYPSYLGLKDQYPVDEFLS